jgi:hypothetical protein
MGAAAGVGAAIGTVIPGIGNLAGFIVGGLVGALAGTIGGHIWAANDNDATQSEQEALDALVKAYEEDGEGALTKDSILNNLNIKDEKLRESLAENVSETEEMVRALAETKAATEANTLAILKQVVEDDEAWTQKGEYSEKKQKLEEELAKKFKDNVTRVSDYDTNETVKEMAQRYEKAVGKQFDWDIDDTIVKKNGEYYFKHLEMVDGKLEEKLIAWSDMMTTVIETEVTEAVANSFNTKNIEKANE